MVVAVHISDNEAGELTSFLKQRLGGLLKHFLQTYETNLDFVQIFSFFCRFGVLRLRSDAKLIGENFFPPGMTLQLLNNVQKLYFQ